MRPRSRVLSTSVITTAGVGVEPLWQALMERRPGLAPSPLGDPRLEEAAYAAMPIPENPHPARSVLRRVVAEAWNRAPRSPLPQPRVALFVGTSLGGMTGFEAAHRALWDPLGAAGPGRGATAPYPDSLYSGPTEYVAEVIPEAFACTLNTACSSGANAVALCHRWLTHRRIDVGVVAAVDIISPFVYAGFQSLGAIDPHPTRPFAHDRRGLNLGEAAVAFVMCRAEDAPPPAQNASVDVLGCGSSCDAFHLTRPDPEGQGLRRAILGALSAADLSPERISFISAHGTGTPFNDSMEAAAFASVFSRERCPPIHGTKPITGHTLGAAGAVDMVVAIEALRRRMLPPTYAADQPDPALAVHPAAVPIPLGEDAVGLSTSSGFGGSNAAIVLGGAMPCP